MELLHIELERLGSETRVRRRIFSQRRASRRLVRGFCSDSVLGGQGRRGGHGSSGRGFNDAVNQRRSLTVLPVTRVTRPEPSLTLTHDNWLQTNECGHTLPSADQQLVTGDLEERDAVGHTTHSWDQTHN